MRLRAERTGLAPAQGRVLRNLGDLGYARATVEEPHLSGIALGNPTSQRSADVSIQVSPGKRYRLEALIFEGYISFSTEQLIAAFDVPVGGEFKFHCYRQRV